MPCALARHDVVLQEAIENQGGVVCRTVGVAVFAAFVRAPNALAAALAVSALSVKPWGLISRLQVRRLSTPRQSRRVMGYLGLPLSRGARTLAACHGGLILLSAATWEQVRDDLPVEIAQRDLQYPRRKDLSQPEHLFQLITPEPPAEFAPLATLDYCPTLPGSALLSRFLSRSL